MNKSSDQPTPADRVMPYEGRDMISYIMERGGLVLPAQYGSIRSVTNVRDTAIIVTDSAVFRASPAWDIGFQVEMAVHL